MVISSRLDIHIHAFDCVSSFVFLGVCVCLYGKGYMCVYIYIYIYVYIYICISFKRLGDYLLSRMLGKFKEEMERITGSDCCLAT